MVLQKNSFGRIRLAIGIALVCLTAISLSYFGLSITSGAIQVGLFVWAIAAWILLGSRRQDASGPSAKGVFARDEITIDQSGDSPVATGIASRRVSIKQRSKRS